MDLIEELFEVLIMLIPVAGIVAVVYVIMSKYFDNQQNSRELEWKEKKAKDYLPIQMQAYERLILFLERIHPERLVFRVNKPGMNARLLQADILKIIREEFDHNLTQQLYISSEAWESVKASREETIKLLNVAADNVHKDATALEFSQAILEITAQIEKTPTEVAAEILKNEFRRKLRA